MLFDIRIDFELIDCEPGSVIKYIQPLRKKRVPKQCPWGTIATNSTLFLEGHSFFLNNHVYQEKSAPKQKGTIFQKVPLGVLFCKKRFETVPFFKKGYYFGTPRGTVSRKKKVKNSTPFPDRGTLDKIVPVLQEGHYMSTPRVLFWTKSASFTKGYCFEPFFLGKTVPFLKRGTIFIISLNFREE